MPTEQLEYICPQCRWKTVVESQSEEAIPCPRCEVDMKLNVKTSSLAAAAANAPAESNIGGRTVTPAGAPKATRKTAATKTAGTKTTKSSRATTVKAAAPPPPPAQPDFGEFRCACCGFIKHISVGSDKPSGGWRCPTCFVKLDWVRS